MAAAAADEGYLHVSADAAEIRVHMIDDLYAAVAREVDWSELARDHVRAAWAELGMPTAGSGELSVAAVAGHHESISGRPPEASVGCWRATC